MVKVAIWGSLRGATDGAGEVEVEASTFKQLLDELMRNYPDLEPRIKQGVSVSIDGLVYREAWFTPIRDDSEVVLMPLMVGG